MHWKQTEDSCLIPVAWKTLPVNPQNKIPRADWWQGLIAEGIQQRYQIEEFHFPSQKTSPNSSDFKMEDMEMPEIDFITNCTPNTCCSN